jgi:hypothetical protein
MSKRSSLAGALALVLMLPSIPTGAQGDRRSAAEAYARVVDYRLLIEKSATRRAAELSASEREALHRVRDRGGGFRHDPFLRHQRDG